MRLFIGSFVQVSGYGAIKHAFASKAEGNWVTQKNLHLTFRFLGEMGDENAVSAALEPLLYRRNEPILFDRFEHFGHKILFAASDHPVLTETALAIDTLLEDFAPRDKPFIPHVTLMRVNRMDASLKKELPLMPKGASIKAELRVALIKSELTRSGARYSMVKEF